MPKTLGEKYVDFINNDEQLLKLALNDSMLSEEIREKVAGILEQGSVIS